MAALSIAITRMSAVPPKRFFMARRMRYWWLRSPSKLSTVSTICSRTRGPAMVPSLVTWPTRTTAAGAGVGPFFVAGPDGHDGGPMLLGEAHQLLRRRADLADGAGSAVHKVRM